MSGGVKEGSKYGVVLRDKVHWKGKQEPRQIYQVEFIPHMESLSKSFSKRV